MKDAEFERVLRRAYGAKESTYANYKHRLDFMRDSVFGGTKTIHQILSDPRANYDVLRQRYPNVSTRKNMLTLILALFKHSERLQTELPGVADKWREYHGHMDSFQEAKYRKHMPDEKQLAKYTPFEDMERKYEELRRGEDPHATLNDSLRYVLLSVVTSTPPKRCDYGKMEVHYEEDPDDRSENYIVLRRGTSSPSYMVFNRYKTAKVYKRVDQELPKRTTRDIKDSLRRYPRDYLFVNRYGDPFETNDTFGKYVRRVFHGFFGRDTGVTMLRHIFITEKVSFDEMDDDELGDIARQMMHTPGLQRKYNWNKRAVCRRLEKFQQVCASGSTSP